MIKQLYVLVKLDKEGNFERYIRKGRNNAISGYDNITGARRGLAQTRAYLREEEKGLVKIWKAGYFEEVK